MRVPEKKKNYRAHVRAQTLAGMVTVTPKGGGPAVWQGWKEAGLTQESSIFKNVYYGTCGKKGAR